MFNKCENMVYSIANLSGKNSIFLLKMYWYESLKYLEKNSDDVVRAKLLRACFEKAVAAKTAVR